MIAWEMATHLHTQHFFLLMGSTQSSDSSTKSHDDENGVVRKALVSLERQGQVATFPTADGGQVIVVGITASGSRWMEPEALLDGIMAEYDVGLIACAWPFPSDYSPRTVMERTGLHADVPLSLSTELSRRLLPTEVALRLSSELHERGEIACRWSPEESLSAAVQTAFSRAVHLSLHRGTFVRECIGPEKINYAFTGATPFEDVQLAGNAAGRHRLPVLVADRGYWTRHCAFKQTDASFFRGNISHTTSRLQSLFHFFSGRTFRGSEAQFWAGLLSSTALLPDGGSDATNSSETKRLRHAAEIAFRGAFYAEGESQPGRSRWEALSALSPVLGRQLSMACDGAPIEARAIVGDQLTWPQWEGLSTLAALRGDPLEWRRFHDGLGFLDEDARGGISTAIVLQAAAQQTGALLFTCVFLSVIQTHHGKVRM